MADILQTHAPFVRPVLRIDSLTFDTELPCRLSTKTAKKVCLAQVGKQVYREFREPALIPSPILSRPALESAVDQDATLFLSANEVQKCVFALWKGLLVQRIDDEDGSVH